MAQNRAMELAEFRDIATKIDAPLRELFSSDLRRPYAVLPTDHVARNQHWLLSCVAFLPPPSEELPVIFQDLKTFHVPLFTVQNEAGRLRSGQDLTGFFREDDAVLADLISADRRNCLGPLQSILCSVCIDVDAKFCSTEGFRDTLLAEQVCLIESAGVSCMISERWWARVRAASGVIYHRLPFDKLSLLPDAVRVTRPRRTTSKPRPANSN